MNNVEYDNVVDLYRKKEISRDEFEKIINEMTATLKSPLKEFYRIYSYLYKTNYNVPKDKRDYLIDNSLNILESDDIDDLKKRIIKCALMNANFNNYNYVMAENYAKDLLNDFDNDSMILTHLADYYTKTRRYDIAGSIYNTLMNNTTAENIEKGLETYNKIINKQRKPYMPLDKENQDKYISFINSIGIIPEDFSLTSCVSQPEKIKVGEYPMPIEIFETNFNSFVAFDVETTGIDHSKDAITEIAAIKVVDGKIIESKEYIFQELVKPYKKRIPENVEQLTGITNNMVYNARKIWEVFPDFAKFIGDNILVGYNCMTFDSKFLVRAGRLSNLIIYNKYFDVMHLAKKYKNIFNTENMTLVQVGKSLGIENPQAHRALADAITTAKIYLKLISLNENNKR